MRIVEWIDEAAQKLAQTGADSPLLDARLLVQAHTGLTLAQLRISEAEIAAIATLNAQLNRRLNGEPLAYILGHQPFYDLDLHVSPATLIPRPETELLIEKALDYLPHHQGWVVDAGTGSGAIVIALARAFPDRNFVALDRSLEALLIAKKNLARYRLNNVYVLQADWLSVFAPSSLAMVVANPPYIACNDPHLSALHYEPQSALVADDNGLADVYCLLRQCAEKLRPDGVLLMEHGHDQADAIHHFAHQQEIWRQVHTYQDYAKLDRFSVLQR